MTATKLDSMTAAYLECALWSSTNGEGSPLDDDYGVEDFTEESLARAKADCDQFYADNAADLEGMSLEQAGHDFWLTRNGHGAGFWDRDLGDVGVRLTDAAHAWGSCDVLETGDDGQVSLS
jgi:hypothetical protein